MAKSSNSGSKKSVKKPTHVYVFIDDSNLFIEGQRTAARRAPADSMVRVRFRIDFGKLLEWIEEGRTLAGVYLVGSRPPQADTFWKSLPKHGIEPVIFERQAGREKGVDHDLVAEMIETAVLKDKTDAAIVLVAGDGDYHSTLNRVSAKGWNIEVYFWKSGCSPLIRNTPWYVELDPHFAEFCFFENFR